MFFKKQILYLKIFFFISVAFLITENGFAKDNKKYELSIDFKNIFFKQDNDKLNSVYLDSGDNLFYEDNNLGVGFKIHKNRHAFRFKFFYKYDSGKNESQKDLIRFNTNLFSGYQINCDLEYLQIYYGSDILFAYKRVRVDNEILHIRNLGICPLFGVNYFIADNLSVSVETKIIIGKITYENSYRNQHYIYNRNDYSGEQKYFESTGIISVNYFF